VKNNIEFEKNKEKKKTRDDVVLQRIFIMADFTRTHRKYFYDYFSSDYPAQFVHYGSRNSRNRTQKLTNFLGGFELEPGSVILNLNSHKH
jgi:hypothetical protein